MSIEQDPNFHPERREKGHVPNRTDKFIAKLTHEAILVYKSALGGESVDKQRSELDDLDILLKRWTQPGRSDLEQVVKYRRELGQESRLVFTARFAPVGERLPANRDTPQKQLSLHLNIGTSHTEDVYGALKGTSLQTKEPADVLKDFQARFDRQDIFINTLGAYIDPETSKVIPVPRTGINFRWTRDVNSANVNGVIYGGMTPHITELNREIPLVQFAVMQRRIYKLTD